MTRDLGEPVRDGDDVRGRVADPERVMYGDLECPHRAVAPDHRPRVATRLGCRPRFVFRHFRSRLSAFHADGGRSRGAFDAGSLVEVLTSGVHAA